jgi:hypothetical protein
MPGPAVCVIGVSPEISDVVAVVPPPKQISWTSKPFLAKIPVSLAMKAMTLSELMPT